MSQPDERQDGVPPHVQLVQMSSAYWVSQLVHAAAELSLADHLAGGPRTAAELAEQIGADPRSLYRLMRSLAALDLFVEGDGERFSLTPLGSALRADAPSSARSSVLSLSGDWMVESFQQLAHTVRTGETGFDKARGMPVFEYLQTSPREAEMFVEMMVGFHGAEPAAVAAAFDFSGIGTLVDVGGSSGNMLAAVLPHVPQARGVLFDLPHVVAQESAPLHEAGLQDRVSAVGGDFFAAVPPGGDAYLLSHIVHDWSEERALTVLRNVAAVMGPDSRLLLVEMVLPEGGTPHPGKMLDMVMLAVSGGQERSAQEYADLLARAGLRMVRVVPTASAVSVVEAVLA